MRHRTLRELTRLADGTLPPRRCEKMVRRVSASPELARALLQELAAIQAIRGLAPSAPPELRKRIERIEQLAVDRD